MKGMRLSTGRLVLFALLGAILVGLQVCLLYTSDAADEL